MTQKIFPILFVAIAIITSIGIRWNFIGQPLSYHQEYISAHTLSTLKIWDEVGIKNCGYNLIFTFPGKGNKNINNLGGVVDTAGNYFYVSYPPLGFYLPWATFKILHVEASVISIEIFSLFNEAFCVLLLFFIILQLYPESKNKYWIAAFSSVFYIFTPSTLWFHCNVYFVDMMSQTFFLLFINSFIFYLKKPNILRFLTAMLVMFLFSYTEWLSVFCLFTTGLILLSKFRENKLHRYLIFGLGVSASLAILLMLWQYSKINGWHPLLSWLQEKYLNRSGLKNSASDPNAIITKLQSWQRIPFATNYPFVIIQFAILSIWIWIIRKRKSIQSKNQEMVTIILLATLPVILHLVIFFNLTVIHDFTLLKWGIPFTILFASLIKIILEKSFSPFVFGLLFTFIISFSVLNGFIFYKSNDWHQHQSKLFTNGFIINQTSNPADLIIMVGDPEVITAVMYYANRNICFWPNYYGDVFVTELIKKQHLKNAHIYFENETGIIDGLKLCSQ